MEYPVKIFIVEDDSAYQKFLKYVLGLNPDHELRIFSNGKSLLEQIHERPSIVTLDYSLPDYSGEELLKAIKVFDPEIHVIIISGQEKIGTAVSLLKLGAYDYISKDEETKERLLNSINNARKNIVLIKEIDQLKKEISEKYEFEKSIIGNSPAMKEVFELIQKAVRTNITVSIYGETGTGKELVAKSIHYNSTRKNRPFIPVNITAIPKDLIESELFGHEKGAFTGAITRRIGKFEEADSGTLFLDEIGEMDINLQSKLLRVIQERELTRIGGNSIIPFDVRLIIATNKNLLKEVKQGKFREDLYYRLLGLPISIPPLHSRGHDIIILAKYFLDNFCSENKMHKKVLTAEAREKLLKYSYPGNVRELRSIIELGAVMSNDNLVTPDDIRLVSIENDENIILDELTLKEHIFRVVQLFLKKYNNDIHKVAEKLDIGKSTIYRYLKEIKDEKISKENV
jgi:DNA-binding NtrC family response regulator